MVNLIIKLGQSKSAEHAKCKDLILNVKQLRIIKGKQTDNGSSQTWGFVMAPCIIDVTQRIAEV